MKERIVILGGGLGSVVTALELTGGPNKDKYEVTLYQTGWRLGGKAASGRNAAAGERIEEHGLHILFGCYENAFRLLRAVMEEWPLSPGHPWDVDGPANRWRHAFKTAGYSPVTEKRGGGWELWEFDLPERDNGEPGDGRQLYDGLWSLLGELAGGILSYHDDGDGAHRRRWVKPGAGRMGCLGWLTLPLRIWRLFNALRLGWTVGRLLKSEPDDALRKVAILLNLGWALGTGLLWNWWSIARGSLDVLDDWELRDFLRHYGAHPATVNSPVVSAIYDAVFAQVAGDPARENLAAGAGLRSMLRILLGYKRAMFYKMQAGMGDTILTPIYEVLKARGVQFRFFHEVKSLELSANKKTVARVRIGRQVTLQTGAASYSPLRQVAGLGCWPSEPDWEQMDAAEANEIRRRGINLEHAGNGWPEREEIVLQQRVAPEQDGGEFFDRIVLGISLAALPRICPELIAANPRFRAMVDNVMTVRTLACQTWLKTDLAGLGWQGAPPVFGNFVDPFNTWSDMSHLLPRETLDPAERIGNVAYLCGAMRDEVAPHEAEAHVRACADAALDELARSFWPGARGAGGAFERALVATDYVRCNVNPSDRYVLSVKGSTRHRLRPDESGFANLVLAGDYTRNGWNVGCVEAVVMSGMLAAQAISGYPRRKDIAYVDGP